MIVSKRAMAMTGVRWLRLAEQMARALFMQGGTYGSSQRILDGYILRANRVNDLGSALVMDAPGHLFMDAGRAVGDAQAWTSYIASVVAGRDFVSHTTKAIPPALKFDRIGLLLMVTTYTKPGEADPGTSIPPATGVFRGNTRSALFAASAVKCDVVRLPRVTGTPTPAQDMAATRFLTLTSMSPAYTNRLTDGPPKPDAGVYNGWLLRVSERSVIPGAAMITRPDLTSGGLTPLEQATLEGRFLTQPFAWATSVPYLQPAANKRITGQWTLTMVCLQDSPWDGFGVRVLAAAQTIALSPKTPDSPYQQQLATQVLANLSTEPNTYSAAHLVPAFGGPNKGYLFNTIFPGAQAVLADGSIVAFVAWMITRQENLNDPPGSEVLDEHYTMRVFRGDVINGYSTQTELVTPALGVDRTGQDWWLLSILGADTDGTHAVCLTMADYPEPGGTFGPKIGVVVCKGTGAIQVIEPVMPASPAIRTYCGVYDKRFGFLGPGWEMTRTRYAGDNLEQIPVDMLTYIGNKKFVFPCSLAGADPDVSYDFSLAELQLLVDINGAVTGATVGLLSTLHTGIRNRNGMALSSGENSGYTPHRTPGRVTCVQQEIADADGVVIMPATLIASLADGQYGSNAVAPGGYIWISYDSGATWQLVTDQIGCARGVLWCGGVTYDKPTGRLFQ